MWSFRTLLIIALAPFPILQTQFARRLIVNIKQSIPLFTERSFDISQIPDLSGQVILITGGNTGLGFESALQMAKKNGRIIIACRSEDKCNEARDKIKQETGNPDVVSMLLQLGSFNSIDKFTTDFAKDYSKIDVLMLNAGKLFDDYTETEEGFEGNYGTHHIGHAYLTSKVLPLVLKSPLSRIVVLASHAHLDSPPIDFNNLNNKARYGAIPYYAQSKLANILFSRRLAVEFQRRGINTVLVNSVHPGLVITDISWLQKTTLARALGFKVSEGALTQLYVATSPDFPRYYITGEYFYPIAKRAVYGVDTSSVAADWGEADRLWNRTIQDIQAHRPAFSFF